MTSALGISRQCIKVSKQGASAALIVSTGAVISALGRLALGSGRMARQRNKIKKQWPGSALIVSTGTMTSALGLKVPMPELAYAPLENDLQTYSSDRCSCSGRYMPPATFFQESMSSPSPPLHHIRCTHDKLTCCMSLLEFPLASTLSAEGLAAKQRSLYRCTLFYLNGCAHMIEGFQTCSLK